MALHIKKSLGELMQVSLSRLQNITLADGKHLSATPGSVARLLLSIINASFEEFYTRLEEVHLQSFVSTATNDCLNLIGDLVACKRKDGETDEAYRLRISKQVTFLEKGNELAIRMTLLAVDGVQDVHLMPYSHGSGSFTAFIITESATPSADIITQCETALVDVAAYGIKYLITGPELVPVEIGVKLIMTNNGEASNEIIEQCKTRLREFINSRPIGGDLIFNEIVEIVMATSPEIYDMQVFDYKVNNIRVLNANQSCRDNERFIESSKPNAILVV